MITRLAPTPSGYLHQGNAFNFLLNWLAARQQGGKVLLRVDDLDSPRAKPEYVQDIFDTLHWLGIDWDLGPSSPAELANTWSQTHRLPLYHELLELLQTSGHLFACDCSRKTLAAVGGTYPGTCLHKNIPFHQPDVAWRVRVPADEVITFRDGWLGEVNVALGAEGGSFVVRRRDGIPAYQIASLADDVHFGVDTIIRGEDLLSSTASQLHLARLLGLENFLQNSFYHHKLIKDGSGAKLSKSAGSTSLKHWRETGQPASAVLSAFCQWAGIEVMGEIHSAQELLQYDLPPNPFQ